MKKQIINEKMAQKNTWASELLLSDAHAHITTENDLNCRKKANIPTLFSAGTPREAAQLLCLLKTDQKTSPELRLFLPTVGLHPWHAAETAIDDMLPFLNSAPVIGEIGMDSVWCDVPLTQQEKVFRTQLALALEQKKPVILHTKGQEKEVAAILREYPNRYLVHWYSCDRYLDDYLNLDCFFSIGPDVWWNPAVQAVAKTVPTDRLLIETDGTEAISWAWEEAASAGSCPPPDTAASLTLTLQTIAKLRDLTPQEAGVLCLQNLRKKFLTR